MATTDPAHSRLYAKYVVERTDGRPVGRCFVIELDDPHAREALRAYAKSAGLDTPLGRDLWNLAEELNRGE